MQVVLKGVFPEDMTQEPGMDIQVSDNRGRTMIAFVEEILPSSVKLDFNHPVADESLPRENR